MTARSVPSACASCAVQVSIMTEGTRVQKVSELLPVFHPYTHLFQVLHGGLTLFNQKSLNFIHHTSAFLSHTKTLLESVGLVWFGFNLVGFCFFGWREGGLLLCGLFSLGVFLLVCLFCRCVWGRFFYTTARTKSFHSQDSNTVK